MAVEMIDNRTSHGGVKTVFPRALDWIAVYLPADMMIRRDRDVPRPSQS